MEKTIKFDVREDSYVLLICEKEIIINFEDKTLDTNKLFEYAFETCDETIAFNFENNLKNYCNAQRSIELNDTTAINKIESEGTFIFEKIKNVLEEIVEEVNKKINIANNDIEENEID